jgi:hypothetical protein
MPAAFSTLAPALPAASSSFQPAMMIHPLAVPPSTWVPKEIHTMDLPAQPVDTGRIWISPASIAPNMIYLAPEQPEASPTTLEIEPSSQEPHIEPKTTIQNPASPSLRTPLSFIELEHGRIWEPLPRKNLRENFRTRFTTGSMDVGQYLPPNSNP